RDAVDGEADAAEAPPEAAVQVEKAEMEARRRQYLDCLQRIGRRPWRLNCHRGRISSSNSGKKSENPRFEEETWPKRNIASARRTKRKSRRGWAKSCRFGTTRTAGYDESIRPTAGRAP